MQSSSQIIPIDKPTLVYLPSKFVQAVNQSHMCGKGKSKVYHNALRERRRVLISSPRP